MDFHYFRHERSMNFEKPGDFLFNPVEKFFSASSKMKGERALVAKEKKIQISNPHRPR